MKIGITGSHGVGKTTLARELSQRMNVPLITETVRVVAREWNMNNTKDIMSLPIEELSKFEYECYVRQKKYEKKRSFITDRTLLDYYVYANLFGISFASLGIDMYETVNKYDIIFYIPPNIPIVGDGFRSVDIGMRDEVDMVLKNYINSLRDHMELPLYEIRSNSLAERVEEAMDIIRRMGY